MGAGARVPVPARAAVREGLAAYFPQANGPTRCMVACMFCSVIDRFMADFCLGVKRFGVEGRW